MYRWFPSTRSWVLCTCHLKPCNPPPNNSGLSGAFTFYASESEWSPRFLGTKVSGAFPRPYFSTHSYSGPFVKQLIIAKRNTLVKKHCWQPWNKQIDLWAASKKSSRGCEDSDFKRNSPPTGEPKWSVYEVKVPAIPNSFRRYINTLAEVLICPWSECFVILFSQKG